MAPSFRTPPLAFSQRHLVEPRSNRYPWSPCHVAHAFFPRESIEAIPRGDTGWPRGKGLGELVYDEKGDGIRANEVKATRFSSFFFLSSRWIDLGSEFEEKRGLCIIG